MTNNFINNSNESTTLKDRSENTTVEEQKIDLMVYELYFEEEIKVVENI